MMQPVDMPLGPLERLSRHMGTNDLPRLCRVFESEAHLMALEERTIWLASSQSCAGFWKYPRLPDAERSLDEALDRLRIEGLDVPTLSITRQVARDRVKYRTWSGASQPPDPLYVTYQTVEIAYRTGWLPIYCDLLHADAQQALYREALILFGDGAVYLDGTHPCLFVRIHPQALSWTKMFMQG